MAGKLKIKNLFALIDFFEEEKFSVLALKDCMLDASKFQEADFSKWNPSEVVQILWSGTSYPGRIIQFGENKRELNKTLDDLVQKTIDVKDIPILVPKETVLKTRATMENQIRNKSLLQAVKSNFQAYKIDECKECQLLKENLAKATEKVKALEENLEASNLEASCLMAKYNILKEKYREKKILLKETLKPPQDQPPQDPFVKIGEDTFVPVAKLALCRTSNLSKYTGDLMELVFGRETLGQSVLKGTKKDNRKDILNITQIQDVISHVVLKYSCNVTEVRAAVRQKLNSCHKSLKK